MRAEVEAACCWMPWSAFASFAGWLLVFNRFSVEVLVAWLVSSTLVSSTH